MTIRLPEDLEAFIRSEVASGHFASQDELVAAALRDFISRHAEEPRPVEAASPKPIWDRIVEMSGEIPEEVWDRLPTDLAENHDHYLYGLGQRSES